MKYSIEEMVAAFKKGMKCITVKDMKRFYKIGGNIGDCLSSIKLDGARLHAFTTEEGALHKSYNLKDFQNFGCLNNALAALLRTPMMRAIGPSVMFDGEVVDLRSDKRSEQFKKVMQQLHRIHDLDDSGFQFKVFDFWFPGIDLTQLQRLQVLRNATEQLNGDNAHRISYHEHEAASFSCEEELTEHVESILESGLEGLVLKTKHGMYETRRSPHWLKLIGEETLDLYVIDIIEGEGKLTGHVGKFLCKLDDDNTVKVGPGSATHAMLKDWFDNRDTLPKMIEVKFKERTANSLRHPRYWRTRDDKA